MSAESDFLEHLSELAPIFTAPRGTDAEYVRPSGWSQVSREQNALRLLSAKPDHARMALMGGQVAAFDVDTKNGADTEAVRSLLAALGVTIYAEVLTPSGGRHFYVAGHSDLPTVHAQKGRDGLTGYPGVEVMSFGTNVFLPGTLRPKYDGAPYVVLSDNLEALADGGDPDGAEALVGWVVDHRVRKAEAFTPADPWSGQPPDAREAAYLRAVLQKTHDRLSVMGPKSGRNVALYNAAMACGNYIAGAGMDQAEAITMLKSAAMTNGLLAEDGEKSIEASIASGLRNGMQRPRAVPEPPAPTVLDADGPTSVPTDDHTVDDDGVLAALDAAAQFAREVELEARKIRVRDAARDKVAEERAEPAPGFDAGLLSEVLQRPQEPPERVAGLIPSDGGTLVVAQRKTGKTTLMLNLARALIQGEDFLGRFATRPVEGKVAMLNFEVSAAQLARWADDAQVPRDRLLLVNLRGRRNPLPNPEDRLRLAQILVEHHVESLIVDPFGRAYSGKSQNDPGEVGAWLSELDRFARSEADVSDVILAAHAGWDGERTRGASALEDWADSIVTLVRDKEDESMRYLRAEGRDVLVEEDQLVFDSASRTLRMAGAGSRKVAAKTRRVDGLVGFAVDEVAIEPGITGYRIEQMWKTKGLSHQKGDGSKAAQRAVELGRLTAAPVSRGGFSYRLATSPPRPPHTTPAGALDDHPDHPLRGSSWGGQTSDSPTSPTSNLSDIRGPLCTGCNCYPKISGHAAGCREAS